MPETCDNVLDCCLPNLFSYQIVTPEGGVIEGGGGEDIEGGGGEEFDE